MPQLTAFIAATQAHALSVTAPSAQNSATDSLRRWLLVGSLAACVLAAWVGNPSDYSRADPELAFLMRGMAAIKATLVLAAVGVLWWRFTYPISQPTAMAYLIGAWLAAGATVLIWQLSFITLAAIAFHAGEFALLVAAWRDQAGKSSLLSHFRYFKT
jgi:hypothetical protein